MGALFAVSASPAFAVGKNPPTSCGVGNAVSAATQQLGGIGKAAHELGFPNVGNAVIQPFHQGVKAVCNAPAP